MWILTFFEQHNYKNVLWFVDVVEIVSWFTWMSGYWVLLIAVAMSSIILPLVDATSFDNFYSSAGVEDTDSTNGIIATILYAILVAGDSFVQIYWLECLSNWRDWA